jgi:hypothetical protein
MAILFDGGVVCKFEVLKNGWLKTAMLGNDYFFKHTDMGLKIGKCVTVNDLIRMIKAHPFITLIERSKIN